MMDKNRHLISKYLEGELDSGEVARFEEALLEDRELREEVDLYREVDGAIADTEVLELRAQLDELHEELTPQLEKRKATKRVLRYAVAASVAVVISLGTYSLFFKKVTDNKIVSQFYKPYDVTLVNRSANSDLDETLRIALLKYENKDYNEAIRLFQKALELNPKMVASHLYSGISYFEIKEYQKADKSLSRVIEQNDNLYIEQARWYLGFCYLKLEEADKAREQFGKLAENKGYYQKQARKILKKIGK